MKTFKRFQKLSRYRATFAVALLAGAVFNGAYPSAVSQTTTPVDTSWHVYGVSSLHKLTAKKPGKLDAFPEARVQLQAARGEWECFQVVVTAGDKPLRDVRLRATSFATTLGQFITRDNIQLYRENFVPVKTPSGNRVIERKLWADALIPLELQPAVDIAAGESVAYWVAVQVPADASPGDYFCAVETTAEGETMRELPILLSVSPAKMPPRTMRANVAVYYDALRDWYTKNLQAPTDEEWQAQKQRYYKFLLDYHLNAYDLPVAWNDPAADLLLRDPRVLGVRLPPLDSPDFATALERLKTTDSLHKAYYYYVDEPAPERYDEIRKITGKLHAADPQLSHAVTIAPSKALEGAVDVWCPNIGDFFGLGHLDAAQLESQRQQGRETWWYTMVEPKYPYPTWLLDDDASSVRVYGWLMARWNINGFVYSMAHGWGPKPLENLESFAATNGDGTLVYPGELVGGTGPMPSIRLMLLRDAIEDYELLHSLPAAKRQQLIATSRLDDDLYFPLDERRAWETSFDTTRAKLLALAAGQQLKLDRIVLRPAPDKKEVKVGFTAVVPQIDGSLNDRAWNNTSLWQGNFSRVDGDNIAPPSTRLWLAHDAKYLYAAIRAAHQERPAGITLSIAPVTANERWRFVIAADGKSRIEQHTREGHFLFEISDFKAVRKTTSNYSVVEMQVPLSVVNNARRFLLNLSRRVYYPPSQVFYTARAFPDADDTTRMPFITLLPKTDRMKQRASVSRSGA